MLTEADAKEILALFQEIETQERYKNSFFERLHQATMEEQQRMLLGKTEEEQREEFNRILNEYFDRADHALQRIISDLEAEEAPAPSREPQQAPEQKPKKQKRESFYLSKATRKKYLKEIGANERRLTQLLHPEKQKKKEKVIVEYTVYAPPVIGRVASTFCKGITSSLTSSYPRFFGSVAQNLRSSGIKMLSHTYISAIVFLAVLIGAATGVLAALLALATGKHIILVFASAILAFITAAGVSFIIGAVYPSSVVQHRRKQIKNDLPFVLIHMSAVAGSGAKPEAIFRLIASSGEYKGVEAEIKKIVNYINLFGYDISTALKTVARTTPSPEFRDLLTGLVSTIESGGSLKSYLKSMADDVMNTYQQERKRYVEILGTYSDIYTAILIAAPLLFMVTLAIINAIGGEIGGFTVRTIALIGIYGVLPFLNIAYVLFLNITQTEL